MVLLGATAGKAVLGPKLTIGEARGHLRHWPEDSVLGQTEHPPDWVMVTAHPSSVLRSRNRDQDHGLLVTDLRTAVNAVD